jgi:urea transporter
VAGEALEAAEPSPRAPALRGLSDPLLRSYSQILFSQSLPVGLLLAAATAWQPRLLAAGIASALLATLVARLLSFDPDAIRAGLFGYNALLVGLGVAAVLPQSGVTLGLGVLGVVASVIATAAFRSALGMTWGLPVLTLPFLTVFYLVLGAAPLLGQPLLPLASPSVPLDAWLPEALRDYLRCLGAIFFLPRADAGALVFAALAVYSRIGVLLSLGAWMLAVFVGLPLVAHASPLLLWVIGYNFVLVAIALGGVWFVPGPAALTLAAVGTSVSGLLSIGLLALLGPRGIPLLILPFNATVLLVLFAMRQRTEDRRPKSVDFLPGSPEENLAYFRTRLARFGAYHGVPLRAPFLGAWVCTQGVDGEVSHRGPWRHAYDFEVVDASDRKHRGSGGEPADYLCYRTPVLAAADGVVARVVDGVPDNSIGELNLRQNWGNLVIVQHGPALFSMVAHLAPGSLEVREGEVVRRGDRLGLCGNSGRSPEPHLHFQLQRTARPGDATLASELHEVVEIRAGDEDRLHGALVPGQEMRLRGIEPDERVADLFVLPYREPLVFVVERDGRTREEVIVPDIDLYGRLVLRSTSRRATLFYEQAPDLFVVFDTLGSRRSLLHLVQAALPRVPFEIREDLVWSDLLPFRSFLPGLLLPLLDLASFLFPRRGIALCYRAVREPEGLSIAGESVARDSAGVPRVTTQAYLSRKRGLEWVEVTRRGRKVRAARTGAAEDAGEPPASSQTKRDSAPARSTR